MAFSRGRSTETRLIYPGLFIVTAAACAAALNPTVEVWFNAVAIGGPVVLLVVGLVRRELRIRRRLDAIRNTPAPIRHTDTRHWRTSHPIERRDAA